MSSAVLQTVTVTRTSTISAVTTITRTTTETATAAAAATAVPGMSMGTIGAAGVKCKISMLLNWNTMNACFLSPRWQISSPGMFAGSCIGIILLAIVPDFLRRFAREYDDHLVRGHLRNNEAGNTTAAAAAGERRWPGRLFGSNATPPGCFRPPWWRQAVRTLLYTAQVVVHYFLMLLAMYFNVYIILCIFIGVFIGHFLFNWQRLGGVGAEGQGVEKKGGACNGGCN